MNSSRVTGIMYCAVVYATPLLNPTTRLYLAHCLNPPAFYHNVWPILLSE